MDAVICNQVLNGMRQIAEPIDVEEAKTLVTQINAVLGEVREKETNAMINGMIGE